MSHVARKRVYLDVCCLHRPTDDLSIDRNRLEAEAILAIVAHAQRGDWDMVGSRAIEYEVGRCSDPARRQAATELASAAALVVAVGRVDYERAAELGRLGFASLDALHVACAEAAECCVLLSTHDALSRTARRHRSALRISVENPLAWLMEQET